MTFVQFVHELSRAGSCALSYFDKLIQVPIRVPPLGTASAMQGPTPAI
jgi:hypothetical protein